MKLGESAEFYVLRKEGTAQFYGGSDSIPPIPEPTDDVLKATLCATRDEADENRGRINEFTIATEW